MRTKGVSVFASKILAPVRTYEMVSNNKAMTKDEGRENRMTGVTAGVSSKPSWRVLTPKLG